MSAWLVALSLSAAHAASPTISGSANPQATIGEPYVFVPDASDPDGDPLLFAIENQPAWATFDSSDGRLYGRPNPGDAGTYADIRISVNDVDRGKRWRKDGWVVLAPFSISVVAADAEPSPPDDNTAPVISGTPATEVVPGHRYSFRPNASDADGDPLHFSIDNQPGWSGFDSATGHLDGTPAASDVGVYDEIRISVTDGELNDSLDPFAVAVVPTSLGTATLSWLPPTTRVDDSPLTNLAGYRILWGTGGGSYPYSIRIDNPALTTYVIDELAPATYYFVVTAIDADDLESDYSNIGSKSIF